MPRIAGYRAPAGGAQAPAPKQRGGLFGLGFGPDINLGIREFTQDIKGFPGALEAIVRGITPGAAEGEPGVGELAGAIGKSIGGTVARLPGISQSLASVGLDKRLEDMGIETSLTEHYTNRGLLSGLLEDIGNVSLVAAPAKGMALRNAGQAAKAATAARVAGRASEAAAFTAQAERYAALGRRLTPVAEPYRTVGRRYISPITRAAEEATGRLGRITQAAADEARPSPAAHVGLPEQFGTRAAEAAAKAGRVSEPTPGLPVERVPELDLRGPQELLAGQRRTGRGPQRAPDADPAVTEGTYLTPGERLRAERATADISQRVRSAVAKVPASAQRTLAWIEHRWQNAEVRRITRERTILADAALRTALHAPEVMEVRAAAGDMLVGKTLPDGTAVTPQIADNLVGGAARARMTGVENFVNESLVAGFGDVLTPEFLAREGLLGQHQIPLTWLDEASPDFVHGLNDLVEATAEVARRSAEQAYDTMTAGKRGVRGLEGVGSDLPTMTRSQSRDVRAAERMIERAVKAKPRVERAREAARARGAHRLDQAARAAERQARAAESAVEGTAEFHRLRAPRVFRHGWEQTRAAFADSVNQVGGGTLSPRAGGMVTPWKYADEAAQKAAQHGAGTASAARGVSVGVRALTPGNAGIPLAEWNRVVDEATGMTRGEQLIDEYAKLYQEAFNENPDLNMGLWLNEADGNVYIDLSQYTLDGKALTRDQALLYGAARGEKAVFDFVTGDDILIQAHHDPATASYFIGAHAARDKVAGALRGGVRQGLWSENQADAMLAARDRIAVYLHRSQPERFPTADSAYKAVNEATSKKRNFPEHALMQVVLGHNPDAHLFKLVQDSLPNWEQYAAWYDRTNKAIEAKFRNVTVTDLAGNERSLADMLYDLIALTSTRARPVDNLAYALGAVDNMQKFVETFQGSVDDAVRLMDEFLSKTKKDPKTGALRRAPELSELFKALGGNTTHDAIWKRIYDEAPLNAKGKKSLTQAQAKEMAWQQIVSDPDLRSNVQVYNNARLGPMVVLMGKPLAEWDRDFIVNQLPDLLGKPDKAMLIEQAEKAAVEQARKAGVPLEHYVNQKGVERVRALLGEHYRRSGAPERAEGLSARSPDEVLAEAAASGLSVDLPYYGMEQVWRERFGTGAYSKMRSFRDNLAAPEASDAVTLDMWMSRVFDIGGDSFESGKYLEVADQLRDLARELAGGGMTIGGQPIRAHHLQAMFWAYGMQEIGRLERLRIDNTLALTKERFLNGELTADLDVTLQRFDDDLSAIQDFNPELKGLSAEAKDFVAEHRDLLPGPKARADRAIPGSTETVRIRPEGDQVVQLLTRKMKYLDALEKAEAARLAAMEIADPVKRQRALDDAFRPVETLVGKERQGTPDLAGADDFADVLSDLPAKHQQQIDQIAARNGSATPGQALLDGFKDTLRTRAGVHFQKFGEDVRGATWVNDAGTVMMRYYDTADARTFLHENGHGLRLLLGENDVAALERAYGIEEGRWTTEAEEAFANDWTDLMLGRDPRATAATVHPILKKLQHVVARTWNALANAFEPWRAPDETIALFDRVFGDLEGLDVPAAVADPSAVARAAAAGQALPSAQLAQIGRAAGPEVLTREGRVAGFQRGAAEQRAIERVRRAEQRQVKEAAAKAQFEAAAADIERVLAEGGIPAEVAAAKNVAKAQRILDRVSDQMDDPSLSNVPPQMQPLMHAVHAMRQAAIDTGDVALARYLAETAPSMEAVLARSREAGFDPMYVAKMSPKQVERLVFQGMRLGREGALEETEAGARHTRRYVEPWLQDRSIAGLLAGYADAVHESHTNTLAAVLQDQFARPIPDGGVPTGWEPFSRVRQHLMTGSEVGGDLQVGTGVQYMIPEGVGRQIRRLTRHADNPAAKALSKATDPWRTFVLTLRPGWYVNNIIGGVILATASGARLGDWVTAWHAFREGQGKGLQSAFTPETIGSSGRGLASEIADAAGPGTLLDQTPKQVGAAAREAGRSGMVARAQARAGRFGRANTVVDELARVAAYNAKKRKHAGKVGGDMDALIEAHRAMVDYGDLSPIERAYVRAAVPFYAWQKGILKVSAKYAIDNPHVVGLMLQLGELNRELQEDRYGTALPGYYAGMIRLPILGEINTGNMNPFADAATILTPEGIGNSLNPFVEHAARSVLGAPEFMGQGEERVGAFGSIRREPGMAAFLGDIATGLPQARLAREAAAGEGFGGAARFLGLPQYTPEQIAKIATRTIRSGAQVSGLGAPEQRQAIRAAGYSAPEPSRSTGNDSLRRQMGIADPAADIRAAINRIRASAVPRGL